MLEICIDSVASARAAASGGAGRVELCSNLPEGGTTPSAGLIQGVRAAFPGRLMILVRPRGYDFLFSEDEMEVMCRDIEMARQLGADGVVVGCLTAEGEVDLVRCRRLLEVAGSLDATFHRAFDMSRDLGESLEAIVTLGIKRILTSGGAGSVPAGIQVLADLVKRSAGRVSIMPGGGVTELNAGEILQTTGASELHLSARHAVRSGMKFRNDGCSMGEFSRDHEYEWRTASETKVRQAQQAFDQVMSERALSMAPR